MTTIGQLLDKLPPYQGNDQVVVPGDQTQRDLITEVLEAHKVFAPHYREIARDFSAPDNARICKKLFDFCQNFMPYEAETEHYQTTRSPAGILARADLGGTCDCKHYSGFVAGVLNALQGAGLADLDWCYRFAAYDLSKKKPVYEHVYVVVKEPDGTELWIDPAPINSSGNWLDREFNDRYIRPRAFTDKSVNMSIHRLSGLRFDAFTPAPVADYDVDYGIPGVQLIVPGNSGGTDPLPPPVMSLPMDEPIKIITPEPLQQIGTDSPPIQTMQPTGQVQNMNQPTPDAPAGTNPIVAFIRDYPMQSAVIGGLIVWGLYELLKKKKRHG